jgi:hypothetical protein
VPGVQYGSNARFNFRLFQKKKPPAKAVVKDYIALAGFI